MIAIAAAAIAAGWALFTGGGVLLALLAYSVAGTVGLLAAAIGAALIDAAAPPVRVRAFAAAPTTGRSG